MVKKKKTPRTGTAAAPSTAQRNQIFNYQFTRNGRKVSIHCRIFYAQNAFRDEAERQAVEAVITRYISTGRAILAKNNIGFISSSDNNKLAFNEEIRRELDSIYNDQMKKINNEVVNRWVGVVGGIGQPPPQSFPIVCVRAVPNANFLGRFVETNLQGEIIEYDSHGNYQNGPPDTNKGFAILNLTESSDPDGATMLHEICHGAYENNYYNMHTILPSPDPKDPTSGPVPPFDILCTYGDKNYPTGQPRTVINYKNVRRMGSWRYCDP
jgi:hypothetical protein